MIRIVFVTPRGEEIPHDAKPGETVLDAAHAAKVDLEGACEGSMSCSTCHVILSKVDYDRLPPPGEEEDDLLDLAYGAVPTSRLGCQIRLSKELDGLRLQLPRGSRNLTA